MERFSREQWMVILREEEWERKTVLSVAGDQQALGTVCSFPLNERQRFISPCRGAEELILYFLCGLFAGQVFPDWIIRPIPPSLKIYHGNTQAFTSETFIRTHGFLVPFSPTRSCRVISRVVPPLCSAHHASLLSVFSDAAFHCCTALKRWMEAFAHLFSLTVLLFQTFSPNLILSVVCHTLIRWAVSQLLLKRQLGPAHHFRKNNPLENRSFSFMYCICIIIVSSVIMSNIVR